MRIHCKMTLCVLKMMFSVKRYFMSHKLLVFVTAAVAGGVYYMMKDNFEPKITSQMVESQLRKLVVLEKEGGCEMPELDPWSDEVLKHLKLMPGKVECKGFDWVECYRSECYVVDKILTRMKDVVCVYYDIIYVTDNYHYLKKAARLHGYESFGIFSSRWLGYKAGYRPLQTLETSEASLSVLVLLLDSMSRVGVMRSLPKTYRFLREELRAVIMKSYNIVGDGTPGALFPMLTGYHEWELPNARKSWTNHRNVDIEPFIFNAVKKRGYRTAYFEDSPWTGTFQYYFNGFNQSPADHYMRPFLMEEAKSANRWWNRGKNKFCVGPVPEHYFLLNYTAQMFELDGKKFCVTFLAGLSHDDFSAVSMADEDLEQFLKRFRDDGKLKDTALFVMGDHGSRYLGFRNTNQGRMEERLPFVSVVLPEKLKQDRGDALPNLMANSGVLSTPFDVHTTLLDILGMNEYRNKYKVPGANVERGLSFLNKIPKSRSCPRAGVSPHWCTCIAHAWRRLHSAEPIYNRAADALATYIDGILQETRSKCARRKLTSIESVLCLTNSKLNESQYATHVNAMNEYYMVKIAMSPANAVYEASMQYDVEKKTFVIYERDISRINAYGEEPSCVSLTHPHLNKYCFCNNR